MPARLLNALLAMHIRANNHNLYAAVLEVQQAWPEFCSGTSLSGAAARRMQGPTTEVLDELIAIAGYLANADYQSDLYQAGLSTSRDQIIHALSAYARFWIGQVAIAHLCDYNASHIRYLEGDCACISYDLRDAISRARQLRRSMDSHA
jgi:hypothetical protein